MRAGRHEDLRDLFRDREDQWHRLRRELHRAGLACYTLLRHTHDGRVGEKRLQQFDDDGRLMAVICHNTDLGDGWEREGEDRWYFREFSEKKAYPLGINIVFYAMTH